MRHLLTTLLIFFACATCAWAQDTLRVLCIGNSFSIDAVEQNLVELAAERGIPMKIGNLYIGGCSLQQHADNFRAGKAAYSYRVITMGQRKVTEHVSIQRAIADDKWDIVTLQQASHFSGMPDSYEPYVTELLDSVRRHIQPGARVMWHMTWAYSANSKHQAFRPNYHCDQQYMYEQIVYCTYRLLFNHPFDGLIPGGTAIQNARETDLGDTMCRDGYHMQPTYGRYCLACTWLEALTGQSCIGLQHMPEGMTEKQRDLTQQAAHEAIISALALNE